MRRFTAPAAALVLGLSLVPAPASAQAPGAEVRPVRSVDLERYQGRWVQVAAIPQPFQAQCARNDNAVYTLLPQGQVQVVNSCTRADGGTTSLEGRARRESPGSTSKLQVSFVRTTEGWNFDRPGTYWVIGLDRDYRWAVVGAPDRRSGFVLSRTPAPSKKDIAGMTTALLRNGYDLCDFEITAQDGGAPESVPLCPAG
ncbi:lipocalin family protein [Lentzea jiangxiensis]|uniref:Apolipoprotein D and lipocalin family protein n=1 Tax=Lentzea jiangxiensis TaxID=641025 RepID=A0A1H0JKK1_9PSEU|nr:lipocalin family protein [Lentzea jiangxiensis]SDO44144.1 apolipoprotein D and lipocalin family protein [Lentzea jiangxiensis]